MKIAVINRRLFRAPGREYAFAAARRYADIDELWLIARREENLRQTAEQISKRVRIIPLDITKEESVKTYISMLEEEKPEIALLINNAGFGKLGDFDKLSYEDNGGMVRLNCEALTVMTSVSLPYMKNGGEIVNTCSIAAFAPNTRMAVYCSTKAYVLSLSKALRSELRPRGINVLAVCPGPMDTEFLPLAGLRRAQATPLTPCRALTPQSWRKNRLRLPPAKREFTPICCFTNSTACLQSFCRTAL